MRSTALVLWMMILLVFVPIGAAHGIALLLNRGESPEIASAFGRTGHRQVLTR